MADFVGLKSPGGTTLTPGATTSSSVSSSGDDQHKRLNNGFEDSSGAHVAMLSSDVTPTTSFHGPSILYIDEDRNDNGTDPRAKPFGPETSFYTHARTNLRGKEPTVPRYFLSYAYCHNSFFARRLFFVACGLSAGMLCGLIVYYTYKPRHIVLNGGYPYNFGFQLRDLKHMLFMEATPCENVVAFSALVYHTVPAVIFLGLPGTGLRAFEPFKRDAFVDASGNKSKIRRTSVFQLCEMVAVMQLAFASVEFMYFWYVFFNGQTFRCSIPEVHGFAVGAFFCYVALFVELTYFARFREHIKMQLGAFKESDQTGNVRRRLVDATTLEENVTKEDKLVDLIRQRLYKATRLGDLREMRAILEHARSKNLHERGFPSRVYDKAKIYLGVFGRSQKNPVHVAAYNGNIDALELLHSYGFEVNTLDKFSRVRFSTGDLFWYFAQFFISKPVESDEENAVSVFKTTLVTPLHCAVSTGQLEAVEWLLARGAEVGTIAQSSYRSERVPPIFLAETPNVTRVLLEHGANHLVIPDPGFMNTVTALQLAYLRGNFAVAQELEEWGCDVALTPFHAAAAMNDITSVRRFIRRHANINCLGEHGYIGMNRRTPLHWAAVNGAYDAVELLLEAGADPNFQDARGRTPLHWAARLNRLDIVKCLLSKGALSSIVDLDQMTPILCAAEARLASKDLFAALVAAGADINYQIPTTGDTALHIAVRYENEDAALGVLACGGNIMKMNLDGLRPIDCSTDTKLLYEIKQAAGHRDVMISYTHSHTEFAKKLRKSLEDANVTTWLDLMDPSGIGGGSVWREEIAKGITNAALVVCILTEDYAQSEWCLKELALAKQVGTPILAVSTEGVRIGEELQVYLYTRQIIPFEASITETKRNPENTRQIEYDYDEDKYKSQFRLLLDGVRDEIEKQRTETVTKNVQSSRGDKNREENESMVAMGFSKVFQQWDAPNAQYVFVSHGDRHSMFVSRLCDELRIKEISFYGDRNVEGQSFDERIHHAKEAILKCTCFIVILSRETMASEIVRDQLAFAEDKNRPIYPIVLNDVEVGLDKRYSLARTEFFHFLTDGFGFQSSFNLLLTGLRRHYTPAEVLASNEVVNRRHAGESDGNTSFVSNSSFVSFIHTAGPPAGVPPIPALQSSSSFRPMKAETMFIEDGPVVRKGQPPVIHEDQDLVVQIGHDADERVAYPADQDQQQRDPAVRNLESISSLESEDRQHLELVRM
ncbi:hypothetical protein Poli38472_010456 [Pythium oligandrum]|uniref:TIR domain-containing protein n=1 Tax=Pythium oligandrum TaxID=41045 RepID=A0A8K1FC82_PYTOL|nr:hypothetical protein Poli38472_010456 [Pythium oligandrum]|eukprot:TMW55574.1 hypothetical protein Poli38472_010456 [Pythium oligandrum]